MPVHHTGPFRVTQYNPPPFSSQPSSPDEEDFDFSEADAVLISVPPAAGALGSPVKWACAVGENQESLHQKGVLEVWGGRHHKCVIVFENIVYVLIHI
jgi:hypothetical protein